jgi:hypothetical protein
MSKPKTLSFSTKKYEEEVTIDGAKYILQEASGGTAVEYQNMSLNGVTFGPDGKPQKMVGQANVQLFLVGNCLFATNPDTGLAYNNPVGMQWVQKTLPARALKQLFERVKEISHLGEEETPDSIREQIEKLQTRLNKLETDELGESQDDSEPGS